MSDTHISCRPFRHLCLLAMMILVGPANANGYQKFHDHGHGASEKVNYDSLFTAAVPLSASPEGRQIVERCLDAYGGLQYLKTLSSVRQFWRMQSLMSSDSVEVVKTVSTGRRYRIDKRYPNGFETRMINGQRAWYQTADTLIELTGGRYKAELYSYLVLSMPLALKTERFDEIRYGQRDGDSLHYIYMDKRDSLMVVVGIDPTDFTITRAEGMIRQGEESFVFVNKFADYRKADGFLFPYSLVNVSMGLTVGRSALKAVSVNANNADSDFMPREPVGD